MWPGTAFVLLSVRNVLIDENKLNWTITRSAICLQPLRDCLRLPRLYHIQFLPICCFVCSLINQSLTPTTGLGSTCRSQASGAMCHRWDLSCGDKHPIIHMYETITFAPRDHHRRSVPKVCRKWWNILGHSYPLLSNLGLVSPSSLHTCFDL